MLDKKVHIGVNMDQQAVLCLVVEIHVRNSQHTDSCIRICI